MFLLRPGGEGQTIAVVLLQQSPWSAPHFLSPCPDYPEQRSQLLLGGTGRRLRSQPSHHHALPRSPRDASPETTSRNYAPTGCKIGFISYVHPSCLLSEQDAAAGISKQNYTQKSPVSADSRTASSSLPSRLLPAIFLPALSRWPLSSH